MKGLQLDHLSEEKEQEYPLKTNSQNSCSLNHSFQKERMIFYVRK